MPQRSKIHQTDFKYGIIDVEKISYQKVEFKDTITTRKTAQTRELKDKFNETQKFTVKS